MDLSRFMVPLLLLSLPLVGEHPLMRACRLSEPIILKHGAHDTSDAKEQLEDAIRRETSFEIDGNIVVIGKAAYFINAHCRDCYRAAKMTEPYGQNPTRLNPGHLMPRIAESGVFLKLDFKSPRVIEPFVYSAQIVPDNRKVGHAFVRELTVPGYTGNYCQNELLTLAEVKRARDLLGPDVPFVVSCCGVTYENLTEQLLDDLALQAVGKAEFFNFNMPDGGNPPVHLAEIVWQKYGLVPEIRIDTKSDRDYWNAQPFPYLGLTDDPDLASEIR